MTSERMAMIRERRLRQPLAELQRKAAKACGTHWSQEELDAADVEARELSKFLNGGTD